MHGYTTHRRTIGCSSATPGLLVIIAITANQLSYLSQIYTIEN